MKKNPPLIWRALPGLALLLALFPLLCSCSSMAQKGAVDLAYSSYKKGDYETALKRLSRAESYDNEMSNSRHAEVLLLKGRCLEGLGNRGEAAALYEYLIKTYPGNEFTARAHGRLDELRKAP